jgi:hypothetical protein
MLAGNTSRSQSPCSDRLCGIADRAHEVGSPLSRGGTAGAVILGKLRREPPATSD